MLTSSSVVGFVCVSLVCGVVVSHLSVLAGDLPWSYCRLNLVWRYLRPGVRRRSVCVGGSRGGVCACVLTRRCLLAATAAALLAVLSAGSFHMVDAILVGVSCTQYALVLLRVALPSMLMDSAASQCVGAVHRQQCTTLVPDVCTGSSSAHADSACLGHIQTRVERSVIVLKVCVRAGVRRRGKACNDVFSALDGFCGVVLRLSPLCEEMGDCRVSCASCLH